ncbi:hypothetical protein N0V88_002676 [Collariella sp. IMI 366227]|nr:hypothetical protein N0V88_002676 [Collariella sp. IMI 366227]
MWAQSHATIIEAFDQGASESKYVTFYLVTPKDALYFGQLFKKKKEISLAEYNAALEYVPDSEIYPEVPQNATLTMAPDGLDDTGSDWVPKGLLQETLIMEQISKTPHPNIIGYLGCRYIYEPGFADLDKPEFMNALESSVVHLHSLGLAHNDINPSNIMVRDGMPVLIDFGSCQPFGGRLQSLGSPGWYEEIFFTSQAKHDIFALKKLWGWLEKPD